VVGGLGLFGFLSVSPIVALSLVGVAYNGSRLGEGRAFENRQPKLSTNVDRSKNVQLLPSALLLPNRCYLLGLLYLVNLFH